MLTHKPKEQNWPLKHVTHERPLTPQLVAEASWHFPAASQQPVAQLVEVHSTIV